ncbi:MAG: hypothetical protein QM784_38780 [Polyangiaceae bacterium]
MVDDSSKSNRLSEQGSLRPASSSSERGDPMPTDPSAVLKLFDERLRLGGSGISSAEPDAAIESPVSSSKRQQVVSFDALDLTPMPSTIEQAIEEGRGRVRNSDGSVERMTPTPPEPLSYRRIAAARQREALALPECKSDSATTAEERTTQRALSYHPPRHPPESQAPPPPETSISVAKEYDPHAPTKPRVRRASTLPPPPALFGLDRMLVWGMVLGGLFVAAVIVLVNKLAPSGGATAREGVSGGQVLQLPPSDLPTAAPSAEKSTVAAMGGASGHTVTTSDGRPRRASSRDTAQRRNVVGPKRTPSSAVPELWIE